MAPEEVYVGTCDKLEGGVVPQQAASRSRVRILDATASKVWALTGTTCAQAALHYALYR
jgi:hypothetical protein